MAVLLLESHPSGLKQVISASKVKPKLQISQTSRRRKRTRKNGIIILYNSLLAHTPWIGSHTRSPLQKHLLIPLGDELSTPHVDVAVSQSFW